MTVPNELDTVGLTELLHRLRSGKPAADNDLVRRTQQRLEQLARGRLRGYPSVR